MAFSWIIFAVSPDIFPKQKDANIFPDHSLRHQRSRQVVHEWLTQQQTDNPKITQNGTSEEPRGHSRPSLPFQYLAYPELTTRPRVEDDLDTLHDYLVVEDLDIPEERYDVGRNDVDNDEVYAFINSTRDRGLQVYLSFTMAVI
jgi:hypothetical protein